MKLRRVFVIVVALGVALLPAAASASSGWQITPTPPNPHGTQLGAISRLASVSCISASACTAVGEADPASSNGAHGGFGPGYALAEHWNGTAWKIQAAPTPKDAQAFGPILASVKCISASFCMAVGGYNTSTSFNTVAFAERWNGTAWKIQPIPNPASGNLDSVACTTAANCIAVGSTGSGPLAEHWNGTSWSPMSVPAAAGGLAGVSCTSASACTAVDGGGLAERWNGKTWATQTLAVPANTQINIYGVKCISATACTAVGSQHDASFSFLLTLAEFWNGNSWQIQPTPNPAGVIGSELFAISCTALNACTAIGSGSGTSGAVLFAENWNGASWQIQSMAGSGQLQSVSCASATACMAVGGKITSSVEGVNTVVTLAERRT
jgi:hypothetical protein